MSKRAPVEPKVIAAGGGTAGGGVLSAFLVWLLGVTVWNAPWDAAHATDAVGAVPVPVTALVALVITTGATVVAAYSAPHAHRAET